MRKMGWGLGLATAGMVLFASHALAETGGTAGSDYGGTGAGSAGMGSTSSGTSSSQTSSPAATKILQGKVEKFDRTDNTLTLSGTDKKLKVDSSTQVMKQGERASFEDIQEGDQVRASYSGSGETVNAKRIDIMPSGSMGEPGTTQPSTPPSPGTESGGTSGSKY
jgi:hypothetical protein